MREIKFRVFNELGLVAENVTLEDANYFVFDGDNITEQGPNIFMQYTGLKDVNGREIYEGDLYQYTITSEIGVGGKVIKNYEVTDIKPIVFKDGAFYHGHDLLADVIEYDDTLTYVGNLYEHSQLSEKSNKEAKEWGY